MIEHVSYVTHEDTTDVFNRFVSLHDLCILHIYNINVFQQYPTDEQAEAITQEISSLVKLARFDGNNGVALLMMMQITMQTYTELMHLIHENKPEAKALRKLEELVNSIRA